MEKKKIDFSIGIFDGISESIKEKIKKESSECELYGVGIYTDEVVIEKYSTYPTKKLEERMKLVKELIGVDFVFEVNSTEAKDVKKIVEKACINAINNQ